MPAFAIARVAKLRTSSAINAVVKHNARLRETPNADATVTNSIFLEYGRIGHSSPAEAVLGMIKEAGAKPRSDSVLAMEILLSASPEYFRPKNPALAGEWDHDRMVKWAKASWLWLKKSYGDNLVDCRLHLDEATPHIQAVLVPLTADGRLSAKTLFGRNQLRELQSSYAKSVSSLGIVRGIEKSKSKHCKIKQFYTSVNTPLSDDPPPSHIVEKASVVDILQRREKENKATMQMLMLKINTDSDNSTDVAKLTSENNSLKSDLRVLQSLYDKDIVDMKNSISFHRKKHEEAITRIEEMEAANAADKALDIKFVQVVKEKLAVSDNRLLSLKEKEEKIRLLEINIKELETALVAAKAKAQKAEGAVFRDIPLDSVLSKSCFQYDASVERYVGSEGHFIKLDGPKFFDDGFGEKQVQGRGSIDLVKHLFKCDFSQALAWLKREFGEEMAEKAGMSRQERTVKSSLKNANPPVFSSPKFASDRWPKVRSYLTGIRKLPSWLVDKLHDTRIVFSDSRSNAVFLMYDNEQKAVGAELKGTTPQKPFTGMALGSSRIKGFFRFYMESEGGDDNILKKVVVTESAIDAISYAAMHRPLGSEFGFQIISTGGVRSDLEFLEGLAAMGIHLVVAYDNDPAGHEKAAKILEKYKSLGGIGTREIPLHGKDWNEQLTLICERRVAASPKISLRLEPPGMKGPAPTPR